MKNFILVLFYLVFLSCSPPGLGPALPDEDLKDILIEGVYYPEDKSQVKKAKRILREWGMLNEETFEEDHPGVGKESFSHLSIHYCYDKNTIKEHLSVKGRIVDKHFKARLYDKEGNTLAENFPRMQKSDNRNSYYVMIYLPYNNKGHNIQFFRLNGDEEILLRTLNFYSQKELRKTYWDGPYQEVSLGDFGKYKIQCHTVNQ